MNELEVRKEMKKENNLVTFAAEKKGNSTNVTCKFKAKIESINSEDMNITVFNVLQCSIQIYRKFLSDSII